MSGWYIAFCVLVGWAFVVCLLVAFVHGATRAERERQGGDGGSET